MTFANFRAKEKFSKACWWQKSAPKKNESWKAIFLIGFADQKTPQTPIFFRKSAQTEFSGIFGLGWFSKKVWCLGGFLTGKPYKKKRLSTFWCIFSPKLFLKSSFLSPLGSFLHSPRKFLSLGNLKSLGRLSPLGSFYILLGISDSSRNQKFLGRHKSLGTFEILGKHKFLGTVEILGRHKFLGMFNCLGKCWSLGNSEFLGRHKFLGNFNILGNFKKLRGRKQKLKVERHFFW